MKNSKANPEQIPLATSGPERYFRAIFFLLFALPLVFIAAFSYVRTRRNLIDSAYSRRQAVAETAAIVLKERFGRLHDLSISLADRVRFRKLIALGRWREAMRIMERTLTDFPMIDRVFVTDPSGILRADVPAIPGTLGLNLADREWFQGVIRSGAPYISDIYRRAAEPRYPVLAVAAPIRDDDGKLVGVLVLQLLLHRSFEWTARINVGPSGYVYLVDKQGNVAAHPRMSTQGGIANFGGIPLIRKLLEGQSGVELMFDPLDEQEEIAAYEPTHAFGWGVVVQQPVSVAFAPLRENLRFLLLVYGITFGIACIVGYLSLRLLQAARARSEAERQVLLRDEFITAAAHELRTPLSALRIQFQILPRILKSPAPAGRVDFSELIRKSLRQLDQFSRLVEELLDTSRINAGALQLDLKPVDLSELIRIVAEQLHPELEERGCSITLSLEPEVRGFWDPLRLEQVVVNLLSNASKYGAGKPIEVALRKEPGKAVLIVRDRGIGIRKEDQAKIFDRFERAVPITEYRGLGLGLFISRRIVNAHGGSMRVESEGLGLGSSFVIELPINE